MKIITKKSLSVLLFLILILGTSLFFFRDKLLDIGANFFAFTHEKSVFSFNFANLKSCGPNWKHGELKKVYKKNTADNCVAEEIIVNCKNGALLSKGSAIPKYFETCKTPNPCTDGTKHGQKNAKEETCFDGTLVPKSDAGACHAGGIFDVNDFGKTFTDQSWCTKTTS